MKKVLICTNHLINYAGSEIITLELAEYFYNKNYEVTIFTAHFNFPIKQESIFSKINVIIEGDTITPDPFTFDIVWSQHFLLSLLLDKYINHYNNKTFFIYAHLSPYEPFETRGLFSEDILADKIIANSLETKYSLQELGLKKDIDIFYNAAPNIFSNNKKRMNTELKNILVISNHLPEEILVALEILKKEGMQIVIRGVGYDPKRVIPEDFINTDAVITIGKSVQYAINMEIPVFCYDHFGGDGWLSLDNFQKNEDFNYSGRPFGKMSSDKIVSSLKQGYEQAKKDISAIKLRAKGKYSLDEFMKSLLINNNIFKQKKTNLTEDDKENIKREAIFIKLITRENKNSVIHYKLFQESTQNNKNLFIDNQELIKDNQELTKDNQELIKDNQFQKDEIDKIKTSLSWKLTKPLRFMKINKNM